MRVFQKRGVANALPLFFFSKGAKIHLYTFLKGANPPFVFFSKGANVHLYTFLEGEMSSPLYESGGKCPHMQFVGRGQMSEGANVRLPTCIIYLYK